MSCTLIFIHVDKVNSVSTITLVCWPAAFCPLATKGQRAHVFSASFFTPRTSVLMTWDYTRCAKTNPFQYRRKQKPILEESTGPSWYEVSENEGSPSGSLRHQLYTADLHFTPFNSNKHDQSKWYYSQTWVVW